MGGHSTSDHTENEENTYSEAIKRRCGKDCEKLGHEESPRLWYMVQQNYCVGERKWSRAFSKSSRLLMRWWKYWVSGTEWVSEQSIKRQQVQDEEQKMIGVVKQRNEVSMKENRSPWQTWGKKKQSGTDNLFITYSVIERNRYLGKPTCLLRRYGKMFW